MWFLTPAGVVLAGVLDGGMMFEFFLTVAFGYVIGAFLHKDIVDGFRLLKLKAQEALKK